MDKIRKIKRKIKIIKKKILILTGKNLFNESEKDMEIWKGKDNLP